jgi:hypothetical protein
MMNQKRYERLMKKIEALRLEVQKLSDATLDMYYVEMPLAKAADCLSDAKHNLELAQKESEEA